LTPDWNAQIVFRFRESVRCLFDPELGVALEPPEAAAAVRSERRMA
jgi:hypothetical protein